MTDETAKHPVLDLPMDPKKNDAGATSVRDYFRGLLTKLVEEGEGFSGKRPFGNSAWEYELYKPLVVAKLVKGRVDKEYGDLEDVDVNKADKVLLKAIADL